MSMLLAALLTTSAAVIELDMNEDTAMYEGEYNHQAEIYPYISIYKPESFPCGESLPGVAFVFYGDTKLNHCNLPVISTKELGQLNDKYCEIANRTDYTDLRRKQGCI